MNMDYEWEVRYIDRNGEPQVYFIPDTDKHLTEDQAKQKVADRANVPLENISSAEWVEDSLPF